MDLSRTFIELEALFADNTKGLISEQDIRDFVESVFQYGGIRLPASGFQTGQQQTIGENFICIEQFIATTGPSSSDVVPDPSDGTITITRSGVYLVIVSFSFTGTNNSQWEGSLFRNGANLDICTFAELLRPSMDVSSAGGADPLVISAGDVLDYRVKSNSPGNTFELRAGQFNVLRIG